MKRFRKRMILSVVIIMLLVAFIFLAIYLKSVSDYKQAVSNITFGNIDITEIADGTYTGECDVNFIYAKVEVTVRNSKITNIEIIEHKNDRGQAAEKVIDKIIDEQRIGVDAVSGATNSSIVLKKAIENAFT